MKRWRVNVIKPMAFVAEVEAETRDEAERLALDAEPGSLCHQCAQEWNEGEADVPDEDWAVVDITNEEKQS